VSGVVAMMQRADRNEKSPTVTRGAPKRLAA
jgi:hypothetical protein